MTKTLRALHLAFLEALDLSRKNGCHEVTLYQQGGEYGSVYAQHGPPGSVTVCHLRAGYRTVGQVERGEVATSRPTLSDGDRLAVARDNAAYDEEPRVPAVPADPASTAWTTHTFTCTVCQLECRASVEAIASQRANTDCDGLTDAQIAESFDFCLWCVAGIRAPGEKVCYGERDDAERGACFGADVQACAIRPSEATDAEWEEYQLCVDCRARWRGYGFDVATVAKDGTPVVNGVSLRELSENRADDTCPICHEYESECLCAEADATGVAHV